MEHQSSTKKCDTLAEKSDLFAGVEFPVEPDFESVLPSASLESVFHASEALLAMYLAIPGEMDRRRANGISAEFIM